MNGGLESFCGSPSLQLAASVGVRCSGSGPAGVQQQRQQQQQGPGQLVGAPTTLQLPPLPAGPGIPPKQAAAEAPARLPAAPAPPAPPTPCMPEPQRLPPSRSPSAKASPEECRFSSEQMARVRDYQEASMALFASPGAEGFSRHELAGQGQEPDAKGGTLDALGVSLGPKKPSVVDGGAAAAGGWLGMEGLEGVEPASPRSDCSTSSSGSSLWSTSYSSGGSGGGGGGDGSGCLAQAGGGFGPPTPRPTLAAPGLGGLQGASPAASSSSGLASSRDASSGGGSGSGCGSSPTIARPGSAADLVRRRAADREGAAAVPAKASPVPLEGGPAQGQEGWEGSGIPEGEAAPLLALYGRADHLLDSHPLTPWERCQLAARALQLLCIFAPLLLLGAAMLLLAVCGLRPGDPPGKQCGDGAAAAAAGSGGRNPGAKGEAAVAGQQGAAAGAQLAGPKAQKQQQQQQQQEQQQLGENGLKKAEGAGCSTQEHGGGAEPGEAAGPAAAAVLMQRLRRRALRLLVWACGCRCAASRAAVPSAPCTLVGTWSWVEHWRCAEVFWLILVWTLFGFTIGVHAFVLLRLRWEHARHAGQDRLLL